MKNLLFISLLLLVFGCSSSPESKQEEESSVTNEALQSTDQLMDLDQFWGIIEKTKENSSGDYTQQQTELEQELLALSAVEIQEFDNQFSTLSNQIYHWDFWAAAYIINGGCSDDCFSDFTGWLIAQGRTTFENAIEDVESLVNLPDTQDGDWEGINYVPADAYHKKTGQDMPIGVNLSFEIQGEEWSEEGDELQTRYPQLWAKYSQE